jgi:hypothetical protein
MHTNLKLLASTFIATLLLTGCGDTAERDGQTKVSDQSALNSNNYIKVAKSIYNEPKKFNRSLPPGAVKDQNTLYINSVVKPRDYKVTKIEAQQGDNTVKVWVDKNYKYATITLNGEKKQVINLKDFTLPSN